MNLIFSVLLLTMPMAEAGLFGPKTYCELKYDYTDEKGTRSTHLAASFYEENLAVEMCDVLIKEFRRTQGSAVKYFCDCSDDAAHH